MSVHKMPTKSDRALELFEKGVGTDAIADRLGTTRRSVSTMLRDARDRRAQEIERAGKLADLMGANV